MARLALISIKLAIQKFFQYHAATPHNVRQPGRILGESVLLLEDATPLTFCVCGSCTALALWSRSTSPGLPRFCLVITMKLIYKSDSSFDLFQPTNYEYIRPGALSEYIHHKHLCHSNSRLQGALAVYGSSFGACKRASGTRTCFHERNSSQEEGRTLEGPARSDNHALGYLEATKAGCASLPTACSSSFPAKILRYNTHA